MENENRNEQGPEYQWQPYNSGNYNSGGYNLNGQGMNMGAPLDNNGNPMKNRFGLKLTFSILEILCFNMIATVCGILGCVFTVNANKAYKEGRWEDFKSARKASNVSLWIGFGGFMLYVLLAIFIVVFAFTHYDQLVEIGENYSEAEYEEVIEDELFEEIFGTESIIYEDENAAQAGVVISQTGFTTPEITIDGQLIELPLDYSELSELGFAVDNEEYYINIDEYEAMYLLNKNGDTIGYVYVGNDEDKAIPCKEGVVIAIILYLDEWQEVKAEFEVQNGITAATSEEELLEILGTPDDKEFETEDGYSFSYYEWFMHHPYYEDEELNSIDFTYLDGEMYEVGIYYIGW